MTVDSIEVAKALVDEVAGTTSPVVSVWEYVHRLNSNIMFAVFTTACYCDISVSPYVSKAKLIYFEGRWIGKYKFMEKVE